MTATSDAAPLTPDDVRAIVREELELWTRGREVEEQHFVETHLAPRLASARAALNDLTAAREAREAVAGAVLQADPQPAPSARSGDAAARWSDRSPSASGTVERRRADGEPAAQGCRGSSWRTLLLRLLSLPKVRRGGGPASAAAPVRGQA